MGIQGMNVKEIAQKREYQAVDLLRRANVGYCYAAARLGAVGLSHAQTVTRGDTPANSVVLAALQFAFSSEELFTEWLRSKNDNLVNDILAQYRDEKDEGAAQ